MNQPNDPLVRRMKFLVFSRHYLVSDMRENVAPVKDEFDFEFLCDGAARGTRDTRGEFYKYIQCRVQCDELSHVVMADVIARCRLLRNIDRDLATRMVHAAAAVFANELDRIKPDGVLCQAVDDYMTHLLSLQCASRDIPFVGYNYSYFAGMIQLTKDAHGRNYPIRIPDPSEIESVLKTISPITFRQNYFQKPFYSKTDQLKRVMRTKVRDRIFQLKSIVEGDRLNLHYSVTPFYAERRRLSDFPNANLFRTDWQSTLTEYRKAKPDAPVVYLPLGFFPEATIDYWIENKKIIAYQEAILEIARVLSNDCICVVKEHVHMIGARDPNFYRQINRIVSTVSVSPSEFSNAVLEQCDAIVVGAGSAGVEAYIRDKPIFSYSTSSYWFKPSSASALDLDAIESWPSVIRTGLNNYRTSTDAEKKIFLQACLSTTVRRRPGGRTWPLMNEHDLRKLLKSMAVHRLRSTSQHPIEA